MAAKLIILAAAAAMLAGCNGFGGGGTVKPQLPALPAAAARSCTPAVARTGEDARAFAKRAVAAFNACSHTHDEVVRFYNDLRRRLAGK